MKLINRVTLRFSLPCHSRVMKQILLRVATMCAEIICNEIRQHLSSHFAFPGKISFTQDSFYPNINGECCDAFVGEEHHTIRQFHRRADKRGQAFPFWLANDSKAATKIACRVHDRIPRERRANLLERMIEREITRHNPG